MHLTLASIVPSTDALIGSFGTDGSGSHRVFMSSYELSLSPSVPDSFDFMARTVEVSIAACVENNCVIGWLASTQSHD